MDMEKVHILDHPLLQHKLSILRDENTGVKDFREVVSEIDLGAGKTAFTRGLARGLGVPDRVTSPTFTIVNEYEGGRLPLFHFDMYRLGSSDELFDIGWEDYLARGGVCAVEWSEIVSDALEDGVLRVDIRRGAGEGERIITITGGTDA